MIEPLTAKDMEVQEIVQQAMELDVRPAMETYEEYVQQVFIEDQNCMGIDLEEAKDTYHEYGHHVIEKWLLRQGYNLKLDYSAS